MIECPCERVPEWHRPGNCKALNMTAAKLRERQMFFLAFDTFAQWLTITICVAVLSSTLCTQSRFSFRRNVETSTGVCNELAVNLDPRDVKAWNVDNARETGSEIVEINAAPHGRDTAQVPSDNIIVGL